MIGLFGFLFAMWILILIGGGIVVTILGPISITGFGDLNWIISSIIKGGIAVSLVIIWIFILLKIKNWIFTKEIKT
ncbi:MAG TPA: hypothetical protein VMW74_10500 [Nitrosopumilaceae archaeon]|nr:hypothetical protein [Nitrosopumilaceae archaeon]